MRGVRVIVVVTNSVSAQRRGCGGFIIVIPLRSFSSRSSSSFYIRPSGFDVCSQISKLPPLGAETFLCATFKKQFPCHYQKKSLKTDIYIS